MDAIKEITRQHRSSVAFVFAKYGIKRQPTAKALAAALIALKDTDFFRDLNNALIKQSLGHKDFYDGYDYFIMDENDHFDMQGLEFVGTADAFDYAIGKKIKARRVARKEKKSVKRATGATAQSAVNSIENAEILENVGRTSEEKVGLASSILNTLGTAAGGIVGTVMQNRGNDTEAGATVFTEDPAQPATGKNYTTYFIIGAVLLVAVGGLIWFLKRKK